MRMKCDPICSQFSTRSAQAHPWRPSDQGGNGDSKGLNMAWGMAKTSLIV